MRCPKCNSRIDNTLEICNYCGERVKENSRNDQYEYSKSYSNIKTEYDTPHNQQYDYSKTYSGSTKEYDENHETQYGYSKTYSGSTKEYDENHETQYGYSKTYSNSQSEYDTPHSDQYDYSQQYSNNNYSTITSDNDYIKAYVGESTYNHITNANTKFSLGALFFGPIYLLYRKIWLPWIISTIIYLTILLWTGNAVIADVIINLILAKIANRLLLDKATKEVEKIKSKNPDKDSRELLELCKKNGTPLKIGYIILINILILLLISTMALLILYE